MPSIELREFHSCFEVFVEQASGEFTVTTFATKTDALRLIDNLLVADTRNDMNSAAVDVDVCGPDVQKFLHT